MTNRKTIIFSAMKFFKSGLIFIIFLTTANVVRSQDVHYSQKLALNNQRNPALRADFEGSWQAATVYRSQWQSIGVPFESSAIWFTKQIKTADPTLQYFGGIAYQHDQSGDANLSADFFQMHFGAFKTIGAHRIGIGVNPSMVQKTFDKNGLTFPSQYDPSVGLFNENLSNGEASLGNQLNYFDLGLGFTWEKQIKENINLLGGLSFNHLLEAEESFYASGDKRELSYETQWVAEVFSESGWKFTPYFSYYYSQGSSEGLIGSSVTLPFEYWSTVKDLSPFIYFRTAPTRNTDALVLGSTVGLKDFQFGLSYDFNISDLELASNYKGGFEVTLVYTAPYPKLNKIRVPCVRY